MKPADRALISPAISDPELSQLLLISDSPLASCRNVGPHFIWTHRSPYTSALAMLTTHMNGLSRMLSLTTCQYGSSAFVSAASSCGVSSPLYTSTGGSPIDAGVSRRKYRMLTTPTIAMPAGT